MNTPENTASSPNPKKNPPDRGTALLRISAKSKFLNEKLAQHYGCSQKQSAEAAIHLLHDAVEGLDVIQMPELMSTMADLDETVRRLIIQAEHLERLAYEVAGFEIDRTS